jgi:NADPH:quinone reductase-like Zn-dependent oxidoreductase
MAAMLVLTAMSRLVTPRVALVRRTSNTADLVLLGELVDGGRLTPVIDRTYKLAEVPDAVLDVERGHTRGKIVISV